MGLGSWPGGPPRKDGASAPSGAGSVDTATTYPSETSRTKNLSIEDTSNGVCPTYPTRVRFKLRHDILSTRSDLSRLDFRRAKRCWCNRASTASKVRLYYAA